MKIDIKDVVTYIRKVLIFFIRMTYKSACEHPFVLGVLSLLLMLYIFLPHLFGFLVSSSPIIICTALLLGTLLSFGQPSIPEREEETTRDLSPLKESNFIEQGNHDSRVEKSVSASYEAEKREVVTSSPLEGNKDQIFIEKKATDKGDHDSRVEKSVSASYEAEKREVVTSSPLEGNKDQIYIEKKATDKGEVNCKVGLEEAVSHEEYRVEGALQVAELVHLVNSGEKETENPTVQIQEHSVVGVLGSFINSSPKLVRNDDASFDASFHHAESFSPDPSLINTPPMLSDLHPLLDSEAQPVSVAVDDSHSLAGRCAQHYKSDYDDVREEAKLQEAAKEEKHNEAAIPKTQIADDEKNLMDLSTSILERSRRLASLIRKRRARKNLRADAGKILIDLDVNKSVSFMDDLDQIQSRIPPVSTEKLNPFDLDFDSEESISLLEIPGSAPSFFLPRENPFDLPYDQADQNYGLMGVNLGYQDSLMVPRREMLFRRFESFSVGASFSGESSHEKHEIKLRPYLATDSYSKAASASGSESISSVADINKPTEQESHQDSEFELICHFSDGKHVEKESESDEVDSVESRCRQREINICGIHEVDVNTSKVFEGKTHEAVHDFVEYEKQVGHEMVFHSPISDAVVSDITEVNNNMDSNTTCSLETTGNLSTKVEKRSTDIQQSGANYLKGSNDSDHSFISCSDLVNSFPVAQPIHGSSPSVSGKSLLNVALSEEDLLSGGLGDINCTLSLASETQIETSDTCSPRLEEKNNLLEVGDNVSGKGNTVEMHVSDIGAVSASNSSSLEENESRSREADEFTMGDIIHALSDNDKNGVLTASTKSATEQIMCCSRSTETHSIEDNTIDMGVSLQPDGEENVTAPDSGIVITSDYLTSHVSEIAHSSPENLTARAYYGLCSEESQVNVLPSITKDSEDSEQEEEHDVKSISNINSELNVSWKT